MKAKPQIHWFRFGLIENRSGYRFTEGYCEVTATGVLYPPEPKRQAQASAKRRGAKAVFHGSEHLARQALTQEPKP